MSIFKRGNVYYYNFWLDGEHVQGSTRHTSAKKARDMEAEHRARLLQERRARGEAAKRLGCAPEQLVTCANCQQWANGDIAVKSAELRFCAESCRNDYVKRTAIVPSLREFCTSRIEPWVQARYAATSPNTYSWYRYGLGAIRGYTALADRQLSNITTEEIANFAAHELSRTQRPRLSRGTEKAHGEEGKKPRKNREVRQGLAVGSVNGSLRVLRRILRLGVEWGIIPSAPRVQMLRGERRRERVLKTDEIQKYLAAASEQMASIATILAYTGLRPDECYRLRWEAISWSAGRNGTFKVLHGKTKSARRTLPMPPQVRGVLERLWTDAGRPDEGWVFSASTKSGHTDHSTIRGEHALALKQSGVRRFTLYTFRHTYLTMLGESGVDPWTLARIAGWSSIQMSNRYVHPSEDAVLAALTRMQGQPSLTSGAQPALTEPSR